MNDEFVELAYSGLVRFYVCLFLNWQSFIWNSGLNFIILLDMNFTEIVTFSKVKYI